MFISSWFNIINPKFFVIGPIRNLYYLAIVLVGAVCFYLLAKAASREDSSGGEFEGSPALRATHFATAGMISAYSVGYIVNLNIVPWNSRFVLPAMLGRALLISGVIEVLISSRTICHIFFAVLVGFVIGWHNYNTLEFKSAWE